MTRTRVQQPIPKSRGGAGVVDPSEALGDSTHRKVTFRQDVILNGNFFEAGKVFVFRVEDVSGSIHNVATDVP